MLRTDLVKRAVVRPLEHCPEGFNPVGMRLISYIFADAVIDSFMVVFGHPLVGGCIVRVDGRAGFYMFAHRSP